MSKIVSFINYKGGVGKSTTAYHVGCALAHDQGKKVLLVDVDPQTNLTFLCALPQRWQQFKANHGTLLNLFTAPLETRPFNIRTILWRSPIEKNQVPVVAGLDLIPSDLDLLDADISLQLRPPPSQDLRVVSRHYVEQRSILATALRDVEADYDYVFIDCPPNLYLITQNALAASDFYVVTAMPDHLSTIGLQILVDKETELSKMMMRAAELGRVTTKTPSLGGIIFVKVRTSANTVTNVHSQKMVDVRAQFPNLVFSKITTEGIGYSEAADDALPAFLSPGTNSARISEQYRDIAVEFLARIPP